MEGDRRVSNVKVLNPTSGNYEDLQLDKVYTLASHNYLLLDRGNGASMFDNAKIIVNNGMLDVELLEIFITENLSGSIGEDYKASQGRIVIK